MLFRVSSKKLLSESVAPVCLQNHWTSKSKYSLGLGMNNLTGKTKWLVPA
jgi:hypothetical protein